MSLNKPIWKLRDWIDIKKINFNGLSLNTNDKAIELLKKKKDKIDWSKISLNTNDKAIELLEENQDKINWNNLCLNTNDKAIELLKANKDNINWFELLFNTNCKILELLVENQDKIDWYILSKNIIIFEIDYDQMKKNNEIMEEALIKEVMKPSRLFKRIEEFGDDYLETIY